MMEGDVGEGSTPLKDLFDQLSQGQSKVTFGQVKVLCPCCLRLPGQSMHHLHRLRAQHSIQGLKVACSPTFFGPQACLASVRLHMLASVSALRCQARSL